MNVKQILYPFDSSRLRPGWVETLGSAAICLSLFAGSGLAASNGGHVKMVQAQTASVERPNIVWIVCEDMSPTIGPYGDSFAQTPNLDRFAEGAFRYDCAWANGSVCSASRSTLITGLYGTTLGVNSHRAITKTAAPSFLTCYPRLMQEAGYYTANNSKTDYNLDLLKEDAGWDDSSKAAHWRNRPAGKPFLAVFNNNDTHEGQLQNKMPAKDKIHDPAGVSLPECHPDIPECRANWAQHYDGITLMDTWFQTLMDQLKEDGLYDDTIIFFYSDHGSCMPGYKRYVGNRGQQIALLIRFPEKFAHLAPPGYVAGGSTDELVSFVDFAPTLLSLIGSEPPRWQHGRAFAGRYKEAEPDYVYGFADRFDERTWLTRSVFDGRYVYIRNYQPDQPHGMYLNFPTTKSFIGVWHDLFLNDELTEEQAHYWLPQGTEELYDLNTDPDEVRNLATVSEHQTKLQELRAAQLAWRDTYPDAGFLTEGVLQEFCDTSGLDQWSVLHDPLYYPKTELLDTVDRASSENPADVSVLVDRLSHTNAAVRIWALRGLKYHGREAVRSNETAVLNRMSDPSVWVRTAAAQVVATHGSVQNQEKAIDYLFEVGSQVTKHDRVERETVAAVVAIDELPYLPESYTNAIAALPEKFPRVKALKQHLRQGFYQEFNNPRLYFRHQHGLSKFSATGDGSINQ